MKDLPIHLLLFLFSGTVIVVISCMFSEPSDEQARRSFPRRWLHFFGGCLLVTVVMVACEHFFASIH